MGFLFLSHSMQKHREPILETPDVAYAKNPSSWNKDKHCIWDHMSICLCLYIPPHHLDWNILKHLETFWNILKHVQIFREVLGKSWGSPGSLEVKLKHDMPTRPTRWLPPVAPTRWQPPVAAVTILCSVADSGNWRGNSCGNCLTLSKQCLSNVQAMSKSNCLTVSKFWCCWLEVFNDHCCSGSTGNSSSMYRARKGTTAFNVQKLRSSDLFISVQICSDRLQSQWSSNIVKVWRTCVESCRIVSNIVPPVELPSTGALAAPPAPDPRPVAPWHRGTVAPWHSGRWLKLTETANSANSANSVNSTFSDFVWKSNPRGIAEILFNASPADCEWYFWAVHKIQNGTTWFQIQQHPPFPHLTL